MDEPPPGSHVYVEGLPDLPGTLEQIGAGNLGNVRLDDSGELIEGVPLRYLRIVEAGFRGSGQLTAMADPMLSEVQARIRDLTLKRTAPFEEHPPGHKPEAEAAESTRKTKAVVRPIRSGPVWNAVELWFTGVSERQRRQRPHRLAQLYLNRPGAEGSDRYVREIIATLQKPTS